MIQTHTEVFPKSRLLEAPKGCSRIGLVVAVDKAGPCLDVLTDMHSLGQGEHMPSSGILVQKHTLTHLADVFGEYS